MNEEEIRKKGKNGFDLHDNADDPIARRRQGEPGFR